MNIHIEGQGVFGKFLAELLPQYGFTIDIEAPAVILAIPFSGYQEAAPRFQNRYLINVCSVQLPSNDIICRSTTHFTGLHPLFGPRTPEDKRSSILTHTCKCSLEEEFLPLWEKISKIIKMGPSLHDYSMLHTHVVALKVAEFAKPLIKDAEGIADDLIPHSFRLLRQFVQTLEDMPEGTVNSIKANPYIT
jgi:prephenate dehydrogenase